MKTIIVLAIVGVALLVRVFVIFYLEDNSFIYLFNDNLNSFREKVANHNKIPVAPVENK